VATGKKSLFSLSRKGNDQNTNYLGVFAANGKWLSREWPTDDAVILIELPESEIGWTECVDIVVTDDGVFLSTDEQMTRFDPRGLSAVSFFHTGVVPENLEEKDLVQFLRKGILPE
jgi:hypothetical protein